MTETSPQFHRLQCALATARTILDGLPDYDIGTSNDQLKLRAYTLLQHAAIEEYLEEVSKYILNYSLAIFKSQKVICAPLIAACTFYNLQFEKFISSSSGPWHMHGLLVHIFEEAIEKHDQALDGVHGIKTKDQDATLIPLGVRIFSFDRVLSQFLNNLGENRGEIAHKFAIKLKAPKAALLDGTNNLVPLLQSLDQELCRRVKIVFA